jgi:hypothetical protein
MRDLTTRMYQLLKSHDDAPNHGTSTDPRESRTGAAVVDVVDTTESLTDATPPTSVDEVVAVGGSPPRDSLCAPLSNLSNCQTEHGLALTDGCQTLSSSETAPPSRDPFAETKCPCPQPIGAAGCGPKYPVCLPCGYTWHCKTCGGCRQCATRRPRTRVPDTPPAAGQLPLLEAESLGA